MSKLCEQFSDIPLWQDADALTRFIFEELNTDPRPLAADAVRGSIAVASGIASAYANPESDMVDAASVALDRLIELEHMLSLLGLEGAAKKLERVKAGLFAIIEGDDEDED